MRPFQLFILNIPSIKYSEPGLGDTGLLEKGKDIIVNCIIVHLPSSRVSGRASKGQGSISNRWLETPPAWD